MSQPAREGLPIAFGFKLVGYFFGLAALFPLAFIIGPIPVATHALRGQWFEARMFVLVAVLSGVLVSVFGLHYQVILNAVYSNMGWLIAWAVQRQVRYTRVLVPLLVMVLGAQLLMTAATWEKTGLAREQNLEILRDRLEGPEASEFSEEYVLQLKNMILVLENWTDFAVGGAVGADICGLCVLLTIVWRTAARTSEWRPAGRFTDLRPHDAVVWLAIGAVGLVFWNERSPQPIVQTVGWNLAIGLFALYMLNGLGVLIHFFDVLRPHPVVALLVFFVLVFSGGLLLMALLGLFDTWGEFRKRIDARAQALRDGPDDEA